MLHADVMTVVRRAPLGIALAPDHVTIDTTSMIVGRRAPLGVALSPGHVCSMRIVRGVRLRIALVHRLFDGCGLTE